MEPWKETPGIVTKEQTLVAIGIVDILRTANLFCDRVKVYAAQHTLNSRFFSDLLQNR